MQKAIDELNSQISTLCKKAIGITFNEYPVTIDSKKLGAKDWPNLTGLVIGEATTEQPVIGKTLIVLLDPPFIELVGIRAIAVFECQLVTTNS